MTKKAKNILYSLKKFYFFLKIKNFNFILDFLKQEQLSPLLKTS